MPPKPDADPFDKDRATSEPPQETGLEQAKPWEPRILTPAEYPPIFDEVHAPPQQLTVCGQFPAKTTPVVAVVGSRRATPLGRRQAHRLGRELAEAGIVCVSGLARGIDSAALHGCVVAGGVGGAILGNGLPDVYPAQNRELAQQLVAHGGFVASEFGENAPPLPAHFPQRNRLIAGLSLGVVVVEATLRSGSLITARWALEQGKDVMAYPGPVEGPQYEGCHQLIRAGATLVTGIDDVLDHLADLPITPSPEPPDSR